MSALDKDGPMDMERPLHCNVCTASNAVSERRWSRTDFELGIIGFPFQ
jgi:hypothetical protein